MAVKAAADPAPRHSLTPTARVILGMIAFGNQTGYDIKTLVDKSTRHFWAASYGQIYPELRRLEADGLVTSRSEPTGGRARTVYELTDAGREALNAWLTSPEELVHEMRNEGMLKLFFSDVAPETRIDQLRAMREQQETKLAQLKAIEPHAKQGREGPWLTLQLGMGMTEWIINWCAQTETRLRARTGKE